MTAVDTAPAGTAAPPFGQVPLAAAVAVLQRSLLDRYETAPRAAGLPRPRVVPLGASTAMDDTVPQRRDATVQLTASAALIGPWGGGTDTAACGHCLARRWQRLRTKSERDALETGGEPRAVADWPLLPAYLLDAVWNAYTAAGWDGRDAGLPRVTTVDLDTLHLRTYPLLAEPVCPSCHGPDPADRPDAAGPDLTGQPKRGPADYRRVHAEDLALPEDALVNPVCGVLGAGTMLTLTSPTTAPVTGSVFVRGYAGLLDVTWSGQANSFATSRALALLEGLERYAGTHRRRPGSPVLAPYRSLRGAALDPADCGLYDPRTYAEDPLLTPFSADRPIPWRWGWSLRDARPILVPQRLCHYSSGSTEDCFVLSTSSGCAIGGSVVEATLHGLLELIERDAFLLGWYGNARLPEIDLASCAGTRAGARVRAMVDRAELSGYEVHAFDNRVDLSVPVVTGLAVRRDGGPGTLCFAAGASLDPLTAIEAALAEVLTYVPHLPRQVLRRRTELEAMAGDYRQVSRLADHAALFGLPRMRATAASYLEGPARSVADLYAGAGPAGHPDLLTDLQDVTDELVHAGFDVIVVDQTTPEQRRLGLSTVATIVPGLLPIDFGWARQRALRMPRLRTAFRRAGWRSTDLAEAELRRVPHPFP